MQADWKNPSACKAVLYAENRGIRIWGLMRHLLGTALVLSSH
jgi:hypothetical protein